MPRQGIETTEKYMIVDPCQMTGPYNFCLLEGIAAEGADISYAAAEFAHEDRPAPEGVTMVGCFFLLATFAKRFSKSTRLRRILRAIEYPFDLVMLIGYVVAKRIDTVHYMWSLAPTIDRWLFVVLKALGCRVVYTAHNPFPHEFRPGEAEKYVRLYNTADHVITLTEQTAAEVRGACSLRDDQLSVVPHGDYEPLFRHYGCNDRLADEVQKLAAGRKIIAFLGQIRPYKGLEYLVEAFPLIKQQMPDAYLLIAGYVGVGNQQEVEAHIEKHVAAEDRWIDLRFLPTEDMKAFVAIMDVLVMPYVSASQSGNTVMAYTAGVPVIATDVGGLKDMTEDGVSGFVVAPRDPGAIADAVCRCFDEDVYAELSKNAKHVASTKYSWASIARSTIESYRVTSGQQ